MKTFALFAVLALLSSVSCQPTAKTLELRSDALLFDVFHINWAWGFGCGGCYVDAGGNVHRYDCRSLRDTLRSKEWNGREKELLQRRFHMNDTVLCRIPISELNKMRTLVVDASKSPPSEEKHTGYDAGGVSYTGFLYQSENGEPAEVVLASGGDFTREPSSAAATKLVEWLQQKCSCKDSVGIQ